MTFSPLTRSSYGATPLEIEQELRAAFGEEPALTIFDVGACEAEDSIKYARLLPQARVFAFEPLPLNLARAKDLLGRSGDAAVELIPTALSDHIGTADFHVSSGTPLHIQDPPDWDYGNKSSSLYPPGGPNGEFHPWLRFDETITVSTDRIDNFCRARFIERIDFMHLDVQGAELKVLQGAGAMLSRTRMIWTEVEAVPLYRGQVLAPELERFLRKAGFLKIKDTLGEVSGDQLYVHTKLA